MKYSKKELIKTFKIIKWRVLLFDLGISFMIISSLLNVFGV
ncbi:MAG: hypothetical protein ABIJ18_05830 [archaeon]